MSTKLYAVFKEGLYSHECVGIFDSLEVAQDVAVRAISMEPDDYHTYDIVPFTLNVTSSWNGSMKWNELQEPERLYIVSRNNTEVKIQTFEEWQRG